MHKQLTNSKQVTRVVETAKCSESFLDTPRTDKPGKDAHAPSLVVRPAPPRTAEGLLANDGASAFLVVVDVTSCVDEARGALEQGGAVGGEAIWIMREELQEETVSENKIMKTGASHASSQAILGCLIYEFDGFFIFIVVIYVNL
jgi:hypothetical protein